MGFDLERRVLIVDDDESFRAIMQFNLEEDKYVTATARDSAEAFDKFKSAPFPVVITDLRMPGHDGLWLLSRIKELEPHASVIVITAYGEIDTAVSAMKQGAHDFISKPCDRHHFKLVVRRAFEFASLRNEVFSLQSQLKTVSSPMIAFSPVMKRVLNMAEKVADTDMTTLITGESGTGKELLARFIHEKSRRSEKPFVVVNCGAMPAALIESELFGHVKGAFTGAVRDRKGKFQLADRGTILLDEITELPLELQSRLLRVLQEGVIDVVGKDSSLHVDVRVLAATNRDLGEYIASGKFREDLFFRLNVVPITIPPLRERVEDISHLVSFFLKKHGHEKSYRINPKLISRLESLPWAGNVRELENMCQRLILMADGHELHEGLLLDLPLPGPLPASHHFGVDSDSIYLPPEGISLHGIEKRILIKALQINGYNQSKTAEFLRIPRHKLLYRIEKYEIPVK